MNANSPFRPPALPQIRVTGFWRDRIEAVRNGAAPVLHERALAAGTLDQVDPDRPVPQLRIPYNPGGVTMQMFWDSDLGKIAETYSYLISEKRDSGIEEKVDGIVRLYEKLQLEDGYLNSWFTRMQPGKRWTNMRDCHELYNAGHLLEGAVAYFQATGKRAFLNVMERYLDHIAATLGTAPGQKPGYPGHPELELALMKLYRLTGDKRRLDLAAYFVNQRGQKPNYFDLEAAVRGEKENLNPSKNHEYDQSHRPVREQDKVVGHAVRAMYLYCGMADVALETNDPSLRAALDRLWDDLTSKRLYITGGMGPSKDNEGFTADYDFPNASAYAETCAAIGLVFWARRMLGFGPDTRYADVMETALYNGALAGLSRDGTRFFYENPLESHGHHHRWEWHKCPCCPPNISRLIASIGTYIYSQADAALAVHLYAASSGEFKLSGGTVTLTQETDYPWNGKIAVRVGVKPEAPEALEFSLALRIPGWCRGASASLNGEILDLPALTQNGYLTIKRGWRDGDTLELDLPLVPRWLYANPHIRQDAGRVALARGPLLYCLEGADHPFPLNSVRVDPDREISTEFRPDLLGGISVLKLRAQRADADDWGKTLYRETPPRLTAAGLTAIPYYAWDNRTPGEMLVWLPLENRG